MVKFQRTINDTRSLARVTGRILRKNGQKLKFDVFNGICAKILTIFNAVGTKSLKFKRTYLKNKIQQKTVQRERFLKDSPEFLD